MKKRLSLWLSGVLLLLAACAHTGENKTIDVSGTWVSAKDEDVYQEAYITQDTIEIYWIFPQSRALYWAGSYTPPSCKAKTCAWTSQADTEKMAGSIMASQNDKKTFTCQEDTIELEATLRGVTKTIQLKRK